jgi:ribosomal protein S18 acetylase RimI-like enzyme
LPAFDGRPNPGLGVGLQKGRIVQEIVIRSLQPSDVDALAAIAVAAWQPIFAFYRRTMGDDLFFAAHPGWQQEKARQVRNACALDGSAIVAVAEVPTIGHTAARVVGFCTCYANSMTGIGEVGNNAVHPDWQGERIAQRLYAYVFERLRERGMRYVRVRTGGDPAHAPARRAYQKAGFEIALPGVEYYREL